MSDIVKKDNNKQGGLSELKKIGGLAPKISGELELPRMFYQLVVFVLDGSGSMNWKGITGKTKCNEVEEAVRSVIRRLKQSKNSNSFDVNIWGFADESIEILPTTSISSYSEDIDINSCSHISLSGATNLYPTINSVKKVCFSYLENNIQRNSQVLVIILSDGALHNYEKTIEIVDEIKENNKITISSIFFDSKEMNERFNIDTNELKDNLKEIATDEILFKSTVDPEEIRKHMIKSISTVSKID